MQNQNESANVLSLAYFPSIAQEWIFILPFTFQRRPQYQLDSLSLFLHAFLFSYHEHVFD